MHLSIWHTFIYSLICIRKFYVMCVCVHIYLIHILVYLYSLYIPNSCGLLGSSLSRFCCTRRGSNRHHCASSPSWSNLRSDRPIWPKILSKRHDFSILINIVHVLKGTVDFVNDVNVNYVTTLLKLLMREDLKPNAEESDIRHWEGVSKNFAKTGLPMSLLPRPVAFLQFLISEMFGWILSNLVFVVLQASPKSPKIRDEIMDFGAVMAVWVELESP